MPVSANIFSVVRASLHDGPGIRTVVYLSGCAMRCQWCHNPEGFTAAPRLMLYPEKCIGCGHCIAVCPEHHVLRDGIKTYLPEGCIGCGNCADACPAEAIQMTARSWTVEELMGVLQKDLPYFRRSGGGVTFSGGECLLHGDFVAEAARACRAAGIHVLVETALFVDPEQIRKTAPWVDTFYVDIKHMDNTLHKQYTGVENGPILENIRLLAGMGSRMRIRTPLIPDVNDDLPNLLRTAEFARALGPAVEGYTLLKYNNLGLSKYDRLGLSGKAFGSEGQSSQQMEELCAALNRQLGESGFVTFQA